jgi:hypothetical protein
MTPKQTKLYWLKWGQVCESHGWTALNTDLDARRKSCHVLALGTPKSSKDFSNADLDRVLNVFSSLIDSDDLATQIDRQAYETGDDDPGERKRILHKIASLGLEQPYITKVTRNMYHTSRFTDLTLDQLLNLRNTLANRARVRDQHQKAGLWERPS